jgi:tetratricopeptide (TPR) repeat protein
MIPVCLRDFLNSEVRLAGRAKIDAIRLGVRTTALVAGIICLLVYLRALTCGFVNYDDPMHILDNSFIRNLDSNLLFSAFTTTSIGGIWIPLTFLSFALDYHLWGLNPFGYHLTNIILHAINTGLMVLLADRLFRHSLIKSGILTETKLHYQWTLLLAGLLFGIHPLRVESVAWVTERKDVLNGVFSLGSILYYLRYVQLKEVLGAKNGVKQAYFFALLFLMLSIMAKPVSVVIPMMLLVIDWYPLGRLHKGSMLPILLEKIPFLLLSASFSLFFIYKGAQDNLLFSLDALPMHLRILISGNGLFEYVKLVLYPLGIIPLYTLPNSIPPSFAVKTGAIVIICCFCFYAGRKHQFIPALWLAFVIPLLPVIGLFQNGLQAYAARYTYLPSIAPSIVGAGLIAVLYSRLANYHYFRVVLVTLVAALMFCYGILTYRLIGVWKDTATLWSRVIDIQPVGSAYKERGLFYLVSGRYRDAIADLSRAIEIAVQLRRDDLFNLFAFRGEALGNDGRYEEAVADFSAAIAISPRPVYFYHRSLALRAAGRSAEAEADLNRAGSETGPIEWFKVR